MAQPSASQPLLAIISPLQFDAPLAPSPTTSTFSIPKVPGRSNTTTRSIKLSTYIHPDDNPPSPTPPASPQSPPDNLDRHYEKSGRRVKRPKSRIARPKDAMPGFKKRRHGKPPSSNSRSFSRPNSGTATVGKNYLNRHSSANTYYGRASSDQPADRKRVSKRGAKSSEPQEVPHAPLCQVHDLRSHRFVCKKRNENKGRAFFRCAHPRPYERCRFFKWEDECTPVQSEVEEEEEEGNSKSADDQGRESIMLALDSSESDDDV